MGPHLLHKHLSPYRMLSIPLGGAAGDATPQALPLSSMR